MAQNGQPGMRDPNIYTSSNLHPPNTQAVTWVLGVEVNEAARPDYSGRDLSVSTTPTANTKDKMIWVLGVTPELQGWPSNQG